MKRRNGKRKGSTDLNTRDLNAGSDETAVKARHVDVSHGTKRRVGDGRLEVHTLRRRRGILIVTHDGSWLRLGLNTDVGNGGGLLVVGGGGEMMLRGHEDLLRLLLLLLLQRVKLRVVAGAVGNGRLVAEAEVGIGRRVPLNAVVGHEA